MNTFVSTKFSTISARGGIGICLRYAIFITVMRNYKSLTDPVTIQFFLVIKLAALTGTSLATSNVFINV